MYRRHLVKGDDSHGSFIKVYYRKPKGLLSMKNH